MKMARAKLKCTKCDRKFSMPAHLARHMSSIHGIGGKNTAKSSGRRPGRPKGSRNKTSVSLGTNFSMAGPSDLVQQMENYRQDLENQRQQIDLALEGITTALQAFGGSLNVTAKRPVGRPRGSGTRSGSLENYIIDVLKSAKKPMSPREISAATLKAGYPTKSGDLTKAVSNALPKIKKAKRISFGKYSM